MTMILATLALAVLLSAPQEPDEEVVVPEGTEIFVRLGVALDNKTARPEDRFWAVVTVPVTGDDRILIPAESRLLGWVDSVGRGKEFIRLTFDRLILPSGKGIEMRGTLGSVEGQAPKVDDEEESAVPELPTVQKGVNKGVNALIKFIEGKKKKLPNGASITVVLDEDLRLPALPQ